MFSFFNKKDFLVDHLEGFIDIHNHILPGIDDGAKSANDSLQLVKMFREFGVTDFICTPHIMHNYYDNTPKTIKKAFKKVKKVITEEGFTGIKISFAAEHMIDDNFEQILQNGNALPLNSNHILIEMSYLQPSINFDSALDLINEKQLFSVFAHPERYQYLNKNQGQYSALKAKGIKFQLNMLSLGGYYGKEVQKTAQTLLKNGFYDFIGSDAHGKRHLFGLSKLTLEQRNKKNVIALIENTKAAFL
ncbi:Capsular polysaccharide synthesis enzyme Cap8C Manganese-dependent protein-tyrosine phosphatase [Croceitalea dokdonensis DOKDO 023]|uniref:protein-tyrosine-phosphatase n=1 Tax=Croceitalea dokdonensis DOKDO 023 TaxID=1300341 RepID=A0A0P7B4W5_9FLAO|nr:CpsB/CapC family capsule biosynthesis tyrosine phosphatase [Croceitalea dokdonensis]KPM33859.1 Capsular polysaccharide synthesis enzyme Cap8C Manganese-dependent protein-tyrosine phosphatase [Croceitalea dokdonensis DOKDO 023]